MTVRKPHPSGKPIRELKIGIRSIWRIPDDGPVIPRLQERNSANAIGFTAKICVDDDDV